MYAIFEDGGKQYKVSTGDTLLVERKELADDQKTLTFDRVLMVGEGADAKIGTPWLDGASVDATIIDEIKMPKIDGVKFKRRKGYLKRWGHRQKMLKVTIGEIKA